MSAVQSASVLSLPATLSAEAQDMCNDLRTQIVCFIDALTEMFPHETDFVYVRIFMNDQCRSAYVANKCLQYMLPHRQRILARDDAFFLQHATEIFSVGDTSMIASKVDHFKRIWQSPHLSANDRQAMWNWFHVFISILDQLVVAIA